MLNHVSALVLSAALTWLMIMLAASLKTRLWTPAGFKLAAGNREAVPDAGSLAGRSDRAAKNMVENMVLFVAVSAALLASGKTSSLSLLGANLFFWARVAYWFVYLAGVPYLRTTIWAVAVAGMALIGVAALA
ncbi:MAG: MAPEG family protein [Myxococcota bacterium]